MSEGEEKRSEGSDRGSLRQSTCNRKTSGQCGKNGAINIKFKIDNACAHHPQIMIVTHAMRMRWPFERCDRFEHVERVRAKETFKRC